MRLTSSLLVASGAAALLVALAGCASTGVPPQASADAAGSPVSSGNAERCAAMAGVRLGDAAVESATHLDSGKAFDGPFAQVAAPASLCRLQIVHADASGSKIRIEIQLPDQWNQKFLAFGGGGFSGGLVAAPLVLNRSVGKGYAAMATDAGHQTTSDASWALGQPGKVADWGHRANHIASVVGKAVVSHYYGGAPRRSYFEGCSNGGRDALMEASRYPDDYDGIVAGAPAAEWTGMASAFLWNYQTLFRTPGAGGLAAKMKVVSDAVLAKCDASDGVTDQVIENPRACQFDPAEIACGGDDAATCLTQVEVAALRRLYQGPRLADGRPVWGGVPLGGEALEDNKDGWRNPTDAGTGAFGEQFYRHMVYQDATWSRETFDLDRDYPVASERLGPILDAGSDLRAFTGRGGKLIIWHGWADGRVPAEATIHYYDAVRARLGQGAEDHVRLFMAPGVAHCSGGNGPDVTDMLSELDAWVESDRAPERIIATKFENPLAALLPIPSPVTRTRPLCAWPLVARYRGVGSTDDEASFECRADERATSVEASPPHR